jgi:L-2-hydroxycarboxylate dehydrogenase (NAD+)
MQIDGFIDKDEFKTRSTTGFRYSEEQNRRQEQIGGDPEREAEAVRSREGIPLLNAVVDDLLDISKKTGIPFDVK